jgi:RNA polymerase sigma factor (sigma-70 family)
MNQAEHDLLVIDAQDGSRTAMNALVAHHHRDLLRFAYSLCRNTALAQDAVQDAWIKVVRRLRRLNDPRAFRGWVYHAVRWRVLDLLRRADRGDCELEQAPALTDAASDGELRGDRTPGCNRSRDAAAPLRRRSDDSGNRRGSGSATGHGQEPPAPGTQSTRANA